MSVLKSILRSLAGALRGGGAEPPADAPDAPRPFFTEVYVNNAWGGAASRSGRGSEGEFAAQKVALFADLVPRLEIRSLIDLGCGDFHWMREVAPLLERYHGVDVVAELIEANRARYGSGRVTFQCLDLSRRADQKKLEPKRADLVSCLDVIGHMRNAEVESLLRFMLRDLDARYLLVANRRDELSAEYLVREKSRYEGIDIEHHPVFLRRAPRRVLQLRALYPGDWYDVYDLQRR